MNLTANFTLEELTHSEVAERKGWDNTAPAPVVTNLIRLANMLEEVRSLLGKPLLINSGYRSKLVNDAVGSKDTSQHRLGCAADVKVGGMTPDQVVQSILNSDIQFDQLIREFDSWTHISVPNNPNESPRKQVLVIDKNGTRLYFAG